MTTSSTHRLPALLLRCGAQAYCTLCVLVAAMVLASSSLRAEDPAESPNAGAKPVSFHQDIRPILQRHCQGCHQPSKSGGGLVLTSFDALMQGGRHQDEEPAVVPGKPDGSWLLLLVKSEGGDPPEMPKDAEPLAEAEVELLSRWIAEGARDDSPAGNEVRFSMDSPPVYEKPPVITALDYSPDGSLLAVSGYHEVVLHAADGSEIVARLVGLSERIEDVAFSPDGRLLAVAAGTPAQRGEVQIWDVARRKLRVSHPVTYDTVYGVSWSPDGKLVAFGCADNSLRAISAEDGKQVLFQGAHNDWVLGTAFSKDGSHLISVSRDRSAKLVKVDTEQFIDNITSITPGALKGGIMAIERHPSEDQILVGGADGQPKIYRIFREKARKIGDDFNRIRDFEALPGRVFDVEFDREASRVLAGSSYDRNGQVRLYEVKEGKLLWKLDLPAGIYAVACRPDGKQVAAGGFRGVLTLIDADTGKIVREISPVPLASTVRAGATTDGAEATQEPLLACDAGEYKEDIK